MRIIALDPGGTTGLAGIGFGGKPFAIELGLDDHHYELLERLTYWDADIVIYETYHHMSVIQRDSVVIPAEYIGVVKLYQQAAISTLGRVNRIPKVVPQDRSAKVFWSNEKLRAIGLYFKGQPHANDAMRHLLYYISFVLNDYTYINQLRPSHQQSE